MQRLGQVEQVKIMEAADNRRSFTKFIFHEVRSPLNSLVMGLEILRTSPARDDVESELLQNMHQATSFMSDTLNNVLSLQKMEDGHLHLELAPFSLLEVMSCVMSTFRLVAARSNIRLVELYQSGLPNSIIGDRFKIEHLISNLISNALKFSLKNSAVTVKLNFESILETADTGTEKIMIKVAVIDQGIGISPADQQRLFNSYVQIRPGSLQKGQGSGLGLAICKQIAMLHGGSICAESEVGKGSSFSFSIPFEVNSSPLPPAITPNQKSSTTQTVDLLNASTDEVLVVDGNFLSLRFRYVATYFYHLLHFELFNCCNLQTLR